MDKQEIFEMVIQEMTEHALERRRERFDEEEQKKQQELIELSKKKQDILAKLSSEERQIVEDYITKRIWQHRMNVNISMCREQKTVWGC